MSDQPKGQPRQPAPVQDAAKDAEANGSNHAKNGIPDGAAEDAKAAPTNDRQRTETTPST